MSGTTSLRENEQDLLHSLLCGRDTVNIWNFYFVWKVKRSSMYWCGNRYKYTIPAPGTATKDEHHTSQNPLTETELCLKATEKHIAGSPIVQKLWARVT